MKLHELKPAPGSVRKNKRVGRGEGSGRGGTSTRGHKGAQSRSGYSAKRGHEGGQMPLQRRIPKGGFKNINRVEYKNFNLDQLQYYAEKHSITVFDMDFLHSQKLIAKTEKVKILARGELKASLTVKVNAFSESAKKAIENAGGSVEVI